MGLVLCANLLGAQLRRLQLSWRKSGLWVVHAGLILLFVGEFATSLLQVDAQLAIEEGQTVSYLERPRELELALTDTSDPAFDGVYGIPDRLLRHGGDVAVPGTPFTLRVRAFHPNARLSSREPGEPPGLATAGLGPSITVRPLPPSPPTTPSTRPRSSPRSWPAARASAPGSPRAPSARRRTSCTRGRPGASPCAPAATGSPTP